MAFHPFRTFQRNQKGCMAGATLLAIISFLFLGVIIQLLGGRAGPGAQIETIAECRRFGNITSIELDRLQREQDILQRFLFVLYRNLADPTDEGRRQALAPLEMFLGRIAQSHSPEHLINTWLIAQYVQEEGLSPGWDEVSSFLKELTGDSLSDAVYNDTVRSVGASHQTIEYLLARQIQRQQAMQRFNLSVNAVSPATRWNWYQRLHRQVTIEAAAVPVDSFIDKVGEPSAAQLKTLFEKNKTKRYNPDSPDSGFMMPTELAFQYIVAKPTQQLLDSITDEEMQAYYEENKEPAFRKPSTPLPEFPPMPGMMPGSTSLPFPTPGRFPGTGGLAPSGLDATVLPEEPQQDKPVEPAEESLQETPAPVEPANAEESTEETSAISKVMTRLVAYQNELSQDAEEESPSAQSGETKEEPDTEGPEPSAPEASDVPVDLSILYKPFGEVEEEIRATLALKKAIDALPIIQAEMKAYAAVFHEHFEQGKQAPPMPDLTGLATEHGLELVTAPMGDVYAAMQTELARGSQERDRLIRIFRSPPLKFEGETFLGSSGHVILYWIIDQKEEIRPEKLDEVREIVLKRWKEIEARVWALKKAEELANEAKTSGKPLAEIFDGRSDVPVVETEPFTWMSYGSMPAFMAAVRGIPPDISEIREKGVIVGDSEIDNQWIVAPGLDFMETVYSLPMGETGVVFNQPQSVAYVVRITSSVPSDETLWERFQNARDWEYMLAGSPERVAALEAWYDEIRSKTGFRWVNKPDARETEMYGGYYEW